MNRTKEIIRTAAALAIIAAIVAGIALLMRPAGSRYSPEAIAGLAQALAKDGVTMYGAAWCPHCQAQKAEFGDAFKYVSYVECPDNEALCLAKGVQGYPTWITRSGAKYEGEQSLESLAQMVGYDLGASPNRANAAR